jgi:hypothetical protein
MLLLLTRRAERHHRDPARRGLGGRLQRRGLLGFSRIVALEKRHRIS